MKGVSVQFLEVGEELMEFMDCLFQNTMTPGLPYIFYPVPLPLNPLYFWDDPVHLKFHPFFDTMSSPAPYKSDLKEEPKYLAMFSS